MLVQLYMYFAVFRSCNIVFFSAYLTNILKEIDKFSFKYLEVLDILCFDITAVTIYFDEISFPFILLIPNKH